jgi:hypothetical protein
VALHQWFCIKRREPSNCRELLQLVLEAAHVGTVKVKSGSETRESTSCPLPFQVSCQMGYFSIVVKKHKAPGKRSVVWMRLCLWKEHPVLGSLLGLFVKMHIITLCMFYLPGYLNHVGLVFLYAAEQCFHGPPRSNNILGKRTDKFTKRYLCNITAFSSRELFLINNA